MGPARDHEARASETSERTGYRQHLQRAVSASAAPYGYTLTLWTCGAITMHAQGLPSTINAVSLLAGAVLAFAAVGTGAFGSINRAFAPNSGGNTRIWAGIHLPSVGGSVLLCSMIAHAFGGPLVWPAIGFVATGTYLLVLAAQFWIASHHRRQRERTTPPGGE